MEKNDLIHTYDRSFLNFVILFILLINLMFYKALLSQVSFSLVLNYYQIQIIEV